LGVTVRIKLFLAPPKLLLAPFSAYGSAKKSLIVIAASKANLEADRPPLLANTPLAMISNANHNNNLMLSFVVWSKNLGLHGYQQREDDKINRV
jgi:hypothetical protein